MNGFFIVKLVENAIAAHHDKVEALCYLECRDVRLGYHYMWISLEFRQLCFYISESSAHREPSRKHSMRSVNDLLLAFELRIRMRYC